MSICRALLLLFALCSCALGQTRNSNSVASAPPILSNLVLWADASSPSTLTLNGTRVDEWTDRLGSGRKLVTGSHGTSFNPTYSASGFAGHGSVVFTGGNGKYLETSTALTECAGNSYTIFLVLKRYDDAVVNYMVIDRSASSVGFGLLANAYGNRTGTSSANTTPIGYPNNTPAIIGVSGNGTASRFMVNGTINPTNGPALNYSNAFGILQLNGKDNGQFTNIEVASMLVYGTALNDSEMLQIQSWSQTAYGTVDLASTYNIVADGDSIMNGQAGQFKSPMNDAVRDLGLTERDWQQCSIGGASTTSLAATAATRVDTRLNTNVAANRRILVFYEITNELKNNGVTDVDVYNHIVSYCQARKAAGWKVIIATCLPFASPSNPNFEAYRQSANQMIRDNYLTFADGLADIGGDATIGTQAAASNTFYYGDGAHPSDAAIVIMTPYFRNAINSILNP